ncbi:MAG TPA: MotA/TolQ/ExbB proton channel family protein [Lacibacter sp.]|nr:MotA/TolQ/ExbB proton channel family protein [Lacibacter sp.]HMO88377.1 MotA/TolQ/ExbB proton channel family protein [Lacibacter sp.]HMP86363.1 MotA/TolQ/ExbB proton channel family protein [Lacibacter sp.]
MKQFRFDMAMVVIPVSVFCAWLIYRFILGNPANFVAGDPAGDPITGNYLGTIHKGGLLVVLLISFQLIMIAYVVERFLSLRYSLGKGNLNDFILQIRRLLQAQDYKGIVKACDEQQGAAGSVVKTGITTYLQSSYAADNAPQKIYEVQKELEEATQLELPLLNRNMFILSTIAQIATLVGLLGTVTGMIRAFAALAHIGEPDAVGLASGISQALVTTALGITTAAITIVFYNYFSNKIERIVYTIDEASFSIVHALKTKLNLQDGNQ